jgi:hypothetical protein
MSEALDLKMTKKIEQLQRCHERDLNLTSPSIQFN